ncbi:MAG: HAMP domain-containing sensor histidine kinase [Verrucomicrobia bacterium]|nr:HAMP domain-containing sensor histidine kinase [Verrucomicrobiota bacterium]
MNRELDNSAPGDGDELASILAEGIRSIGLVVLVRNPGDGVSDESFEIVGRAPDWLGTWLGAETSMLEHSPFLEDFVNGAAREFWDGPASENVLRSGLWEESPASSDVDETSETAPRFFEASALRTASGKAVLLIEPADERLKREQAYLQSVHVLNLDRRHLQKELEKKQILLECITHDLGSPLANELKNLEQIARQLADQPQLQSAVQRAIRQTERQRSLVNSIAEVFAADMAKMRSPNADGSEAPDLVAVAAEVLSACASSAAEKSVTLCPFFTSPLPVVGDKVYLSRLIDNLLLNAIRHSPEGAAVMIHFDEKDGFAMVRVEDEGSGIDPEEVETIFDPFVQGRAGGKGQSGLGLYFCRRTAEMWGGRVEVWNRPEGGACFELWLPRFRAVI